MRPTDGFIHSATHSLVSGIIVHNEKDAAGMMGLALLIEIFDAVDEEIVDCWNGRCKVGTSQCRGFDQAKALDIHRSLAHVSDPSRYKSNDWFDPDHSRFDSHSAQASRNLSTFLAETQCADVLITQRWVQNRLWHLCLSHGLLKADSETRELSFHYAFSIAEATLDVCRSVRISAMEAHGIGIVSIVYREHRTVDDELFT